MVICSKFEHFDTLTNAYFHINMILCKFYVFLFFRVLGAVRFSKIQGKYKLYGGTQGEVKKHNLKVT